MKPTFLGIGAQRSGTTRLHLLLQAHPDIQMPREGHNPYGKELHFFSQTQSRKTLHWYQRQFKPARGTLAKPVRGEITPAYATLSTACVKELARYQPNLRILFVIRNPIERIWSQLIMNLTCWGEAANIEIEDERLSVPYLIHMAESDAVYLRTDYARTLAIWSEAFGREAVHVTLYEDLIAQPSASFAALLTHIGANHHWLPPQSLFEEPIFSSPSYPIPESFKWYLACRWLPKIQQLNRQLAGRLDHWLESLMDIRAQRPAADELALIRKPIKTLKSRRYPSPEQQLIDEQRLETLLSVLRSQTSVMAV